MKQEGNILEQSDIKQRICSEEEASKTSYFKNNPMKQNLKKELKAMIDLINKKEI
jgi:hypothetical protein